MNKIIQLSISILLILLVSSFNQVNGQTNVSVSTAKLINSFPHTENNLNSSNGGSATGMQGACPQILCCSVLVYKVVLPSFGSLRVDMTNFTPLGGSVISYTPNIANPTNWSDLSYFSNVGNFCGFRDSLQLGNKYDWGTNSWDASASSALTSDVCPPGEYYVIFFNNNNQVNIGSASSDLIFQFAPFCPTGYECGTIDTSFCSSSLYTSPSGKNYTVAGTYTDTVLGVGTGGNDSLYTINLAPCYGSNYDIVITEINYNGAEWGVDSTEFIELYNNGIGVVDLSSWSFTSGVVFTFPSVLINAGEYMVIAIDSAAIRHSYGYSSALQWTSGLLSNNGEPITLKDNNGVTIDSLRYDDNLPWPSGADGDGYSLVLCDHSDDNLLGANWTISATPTGNIVEGETVYGSPGASDDGCTVCIESTNSISPTVCNSYNSPSGNYLWTSTGVYKDTIINAAGCDSVITINLTIGTSPVIPAIVIDSNISCNGFADGGMTASATLGSAPYIYAWSNAATTASIAGITAGTYSVTITDDNGCTASTSSTVTQPTLLVASTIINSNISCNGFTDGGITASATGGTAPYAYAWSNAATTATISGIAAGTYTVTITDNNGCTSINSSTITEPTVLIAATVVDSNVSCNSISDGGATASATGGTMPYTYLWNNAAATASIAGVTAGTYTVTVTDANGCISNNSAIVTEPAPVTSPTFSGLAADYCEDAAIVTLSGLPTGGTFTGNGITGNDFDPASANSGSNDIKYTITDANGCQSFIINATVINALPVITITGLAPDYCENAATATIIATPSGTGGVWTGDIASNGDFNPAIQGVGQHTVYYTFTDANSCSNTDSAMTMVNNLPTVALTTLADVCADANNFMISGATPAGGNWSGNGVSSNYFNATVAGAGSHYLTYTYTDVNGCVNLDSTTQLVNALPVLNVTGLDAAYCADADNDTLTATPAGGSFFGVGMTADVFDPSVPNTGSVSIMYMYADAVTGCFNSQSAITMVNSIPMVNLGSDNTVCEYSAYMLDAGNPGATYLWSNGATTQTIVLDTNGYGIGDFMYNVLVTDANMCTNMDSVEITYEATPVSQLTDTNTICGENADITLDAGYISGNTYVWSNGVSWSSITINSSDLGGNMGNMSVEITSDAGCVYNDTIFVYFREVPVIDLGGDQIVCVNHEFTIDAGAGYTSYLWNTGATNQAITIDDNTFSIGQNILKVEVYNDVNCSAMDSMILVVDPCTGVEKSELNSDDIHIYPNPNNGEFTLDINAISQDVNIEIMSAYGQVIYKQNYKATQSRIIEFNKSNLAKGIYFIRISNENIMIQKKVNIQ